MTEPQGENHQFSQNFHNISEFEQASSRMINNDEMNSIQVNNFSYKNISQDQQSESIMVQSQFSEYRKVANLMINDNNESKQQPPTSYQTVQQHSLIYQNSQPHIQEQQGPSQRIVVCLQSLSWSLRKVYYRNFFNRLITFYIQSLKEQQRRIRQTKEIQIKQLKEQNWPFKELFYKKYRNPNQQIMFEFINLCAQKIQATFKAYIMNKRHKQAISKINIFKQKLKAIVKGWKSSNIYNCKKLKQIRKNFIQISQQIDQEIENPNIDRIKKMKKIQYLQLSQQTVRENFMKCFGYLYETGTWIFQMQKCFKQPIFGHKSKNCGFEMNQIQSITQFNNFGPKIHKDTGEEQIQREEQTQNQRQQSQKKTRQRQFRGSKNQSKNNAKQLKKQTHPIEQNFQTISNNRSSLPTTNYQSGGQQRPIMAKGKYEFTEQDIKSNENQFLKVNNLKQKEHQSATDKNDTNEENRQQPRINKFKDEEKKRLVKRQKYDPRKAIQEEKKRIEQEKRIKLQKQKQQGVHQKKPQPKQQKQEINPLVRKGNKKQSQISNKRTPRKQKAQPQQKQQPQLQAAQSPRESNNQKTLEKIKKESKLNRKGDNNKSIKSISVNNKKVESKVDCWGPKRESVYEKAEKGFTGQESSYKSKYLAGLKEKNELKHNINDNPMTTNSIINKKREQNNIYKFKQQQWTPIEQNLNQYQQEQQDFSQQMKQRLSYSHFRQNKQQQCSQNEYQEEGEQEETYQSSYLRKLVEERESGKFSYGNRKIIPGRTRSTEKLIVKKQQEKLQQRFQHLSNHIKQRISSSIEATQNPSTTTKQKPSQASQKKSTNQSHRPIESLQQVYCSHYTDRLNNLKTKLNMLESARYIQRDESIPVLLEDSRYVKKMYKDGAFSTLYWPQVRTMETAFLDYVKLTGF